MQWNAFTVALRQRAFFNAKLLNPWMFDTIWLFNQNV